ncbi:MAG TPA: glycosyltransferase family 4 protein [Gammaproteobacteria bacterium]|nr:glycosyltransferase family 4 protein [Gammaproteobacteria bacterium]
MLRVAIIEPVGGHCGMDYYDFGLARGLANAGADVVLHTCDETEIPRDAPFEVRLSYRGIFGEAPKWRRALRYMRGALGALVSAVGERRRIVHFHLFHIRFAELANIVVARLLGRKVVITAHDVESFVGSLESRRIRKFVYGAADRVIAHNDVSRVELIENVGVDERKIRQIRHGNFLGLVPELPDSAAARRRVGVSPAARVILYFGQIKEVKGVDVLLRAMPGVVAQFPDAVLLLAGKSWKTDFSRYQAVIDELGIGASCVVHHRFIPPEELPSFFSAADVIALPYRRIYQSGVVLLSMSYGKPVVASDLPGFTQLLEDGVSGYVFSDGDPESLCARLCAALADRSEREAVGRAALEKVIEHYDWDHSGRDTARVYEEIL